MATSALAKLRGPQKPKIVHPLPERVAHWGPPGASMYISTPAEIDALVQKIPPGRVATLQSLRDHLAKSHGTTIVCPVTTGIFLGICARAAAEMAALGAPQITPYWRVLKTDGRLNEKFPGGIAAQRLKLEAEGIPVVADGRSHLKVPDALSRLAQL